MRCIIVTGLSGGGRSLALHQLEDMGYFCVDPDSREGAPVFNRVVALKDTWAKEAKK